MNMRVESVGAVPASDAVRVALRCAPDARGAALANEAVPDVCVFEVRGAGDVAACVAVASLVEGRIACQAFLVGASSELALELARSGAFRLVELSEGLQADLACSLMQAGVAVVERFSVAGASDVARANASRADLVALRLGEGVAWEVLDQIDRPFVLAGASCDADVRASVAAARPYGLWGVELSQGGAPEVDAARGFSARR